MREKRELKGFIFTSSGGLSDCLGVREGVFGEGTCAGVALLIYGCVVEEAGAVD